MKLFALALLTAALAAVFVSGCQDEDAEFIEGWYWVPDKTGLMPCRLRHWVWIPEYADEVGYWRRAGRDRLIAHVVPDLQQPRGSDGLRPCDVFAKVDEESARVMRAPALPYGFASESIYQHEERHWREGMVHPT